jgi:antitoxin FitA
MAQLIVRNLENAIKTGLQLRATRHGHSMEEEVRNILTAAVSKSIESPKKLGTWVASLFKDEGLSSPIKEHRGQSVKPAKFK